MRNTTLRLAQLLPMLALVACGTARDVDRSMPLRPLILLGHRPVPHQIVYKESVVGGFSGIDRVNDSTYYIISDDRSVKSPARFYVLSFHYDSAAITERPTSVVTMRDRGGQPYPPGSVDPEAIRYDRSSNTLWWTSEGDERLAINPSIREMELDGSFVRELPLPPMFMFNTGDRRGPRANGVFEGMSISADGSTLIVSTEDPLRQDGPAISHTTTSPVRISFLDRASGALVRQIAYVPERATTPPSDTVESGNGVVEVLARDTNHLLVLERGFTPGIGNTVRLFEADISAATDVSAIDALAGATFTAAPKKLIADFATFGAHLVDNIEGLSWGPMLPDGRRTLIAVSDDNFNPEQMTLIYLLAESGR